MENFRSQFPYLKTGKKYFDHAAISPLPLSVKEEIDNYLKIRSETEIEPYYETLNEAKGAKEKLSQLLNVKSELLAWSSNVSNSLNVLAQGLDWKNGDEIILNDIEFPSNIYPFLNLKKQSVNIKFAKNSHGKVDLKEIEPLVTEKTKLISISMVQFLSGYRADLKTLGDFCKNNNIIFCVDGIQGVGCIKTNLEECNIDFFSGGTHKWLMGLQGLGYFYISEKIIEKVDQKFVGWTSVNNPWNLLNYDLNLMNGAIKFENGTLPRIAIIALNASLNFFNTIGQEVIEEKIINNSLYLLDRLNELGFNTILQKIDEKELSGIISFTDENASKIVENLKRANIICSLREGIIRLSPHFYNTREDLDYLISELKNMFIS